MVCIMKPWSFFLIIIFVDILMSSRTITGLKMISVPSSKGENTQSSSSLKSTTTTTVNVRLSSNSLYNIMSQQPNNIVPTHHHRKKQHQKASSTTTITTRTITKPSSSVTLFASSGPQENEKLGNDNEDNNNEDRWTPLSTKEKIILPIRLIFGIYLLLLLPSGIATTKSCYCGAKVMGTLPFEYITFFSLLVIPRSYRYGKFAKPIKKSAEKESNKKATSIIEVLAFISTLVGSHWIASYTFALQKKSMLAPKFFLILRLLSTILVAMSGWYLDKSYDRVTRPHQLIQTGPYDIIRHPIYTSYLILFASTLLTLKAYVCCIAMIGIATIFYKHRMDSEEQLLKETFGIDYEQYQERVRWRLIPWLY